MTHINTNSSFNSTTKGVHIWHNDCLWGVDYNIGFLSPLCHWCQRTRSNIITHMFTNIYLKPNVLPNQVSREGDIYICTHILQVFSLPTGLWCLLLSPTPIKVIFLASTMMLSSFYNYCIYSLCSHKAVCFFFCSCTRFVFK